MCSHSLYLLLRWSITDNGTVNLWNSAVQFLSKFVPVGDQSEMCAIEFWPTVCTETGTIRYCLLILIWRNEWAPLLWRDGNIDFSIWNQSWWRFCQLECVNLTSVRTVSLLAPNTQNKVTNCRLLSGGTDENLYGINIVWNYSHAKLICESQLIQSLSSALTCTQW